MTTIKIKREALRQWAAEKRGKLRETPLFPHEADITADRIYKALGLATCEHVTLIIGDE